MVWTTSSRSVSSQIAAREPALSATGGLFSPSTGIVDSHAYMLALLGDAEAAGASLVRNATVTAITRSGSDYHLTVHNAGEAMTLETRLLVNSKPAFWGAPELPD